MYIIYSGGFDKHSQASLHASIMHTYADAVKEHIQNGKKIAYVTLAKPDGYYDDELRTLFGTTIDIIDSVRVNSTKWNTYDVICILGGNTRTLHEQLTKSGFSLSALKPEVILLGDSAGAYVLSAHYYDADLSDEHATLTFHEGLNPSSRIITIAHMNNPHYTNAHLRAQVYEFAAERDLRILELSENEQQIWIDGIFLADEIDTLLKS